MKSETVYVYYEERNTAIDLLPSIMPDLPRLTPLFSGSVQNVKLSHSREDAVQGVITGIQRGKKLYGMNPPYPTAVLKDFVATTLAEKGAVELPMTQEGGFISYYSIVVAPIEISEGTQLYMYSYEAMSEDVVEAIDQYGQSIICDGIENATDNIKYISKELQSHAIQPPKTLCFDCNTIATMLKETGRFGLPLQNRQGKTVAKLYLDAIR